jgi:hypothetical protein
MGRGGGGEWKTNYSTPAYCKEFVKTIEIVTGHMA